MQVLNRRICSIKIFIYVYTQQYPTIVSNYNFYLVRGDMFRLLMQPSSGQLKVEQESSCVHNMGSHIQIIIYCVATCFGCSCSHLQASLK